MWWEWNQNSGMSAWRDCVSVMLLPHFEVFCYLVLSLLSSLVKDWFINFICLIFHLLQCPHDVKCARSDAETRDHPCNFEQRVQLALCQVCYERDKKVICLLLRLGFNNWIDKTIEAIVKLAFWAFVPFVIVNWIHSVKGLTIEKSAVQYLHIYVIKPVIN